MNLSKVKVEIIMNYNESMLEKNELYTIIDSGEKYELYPDNTWAEWKHDWNKEKIDNIDEFVKNIIHHFALWWHHHKRMNVWDILTIEGNYYKYLWKEE